MADISKLNLKGTIYNIKDAEARQMIDEMPAPMIFKGSLGEGGTISSLPAASHQSEGFVYKVITEGTYIGQFARVGDLFICNDEPAWVLIPSGDDPSGTGTVTNVATGTGLTGGPITTSGTISVDFNAVQAPIEDLSTIRAGATAGATALQSGDNISELNNDSGYLVTSDFKTINNSSVIGTGNVSLQEPLVSGTNIKTVNNQSLLGSGDITIQSGSEYTAGDGINITSSSEGDVIENTAGMYLGDDASPATALIDADLLGGQASSYYQPKLTAGTGITITGATNVVAADRNATNTYTKTEVDNLLLQKITDTTSTSATIASMATNIVYVYTQPLTALTITAVQEGPTGVIFKSGATATNVTLPANVVTPEGYEIKANKTYEFNIMNNLLVMGEW